MPVEGHLDPVRKQPDGLRPGRLLDGSSLIPVGRCVLGMVMGRLVEENPTASLIKVPGIKVWDIKVPAP